MEILVANHDLKCSEDLVFKAVMLWVEQRQAKVRMRAKRETSEIRRLLQRIEDDVDHLSPVEADTRRKALKV